MPNKRSTPSDPAIAERSALATAKEVHLESGVPTRSLAALDREKKELARNVLAMYPELPSVNLLRYAIKMAPPDFMAEFDISLHNRELLKAIRAERAQSRRQERESMWTSEEIREAALTLPAKVPIGRNKFVRREDLEYPHTGMYLTVLNKQDLDAHKKNRKALAVRTIRRLWPRSKRARKMRLIEVDRLF